MSKSDPLRRCSKAMGKHQKTLQLIAAAYEVLAADHPMTVRQVYYRLVSGQVIKNTRSQYQAVSNALVDARKEGVIPWEWIEDRLRRPRRVPMWEDLADFIQTVLRSYRRNIWAEQPLYLEVWLEKDALSGIFEDVLRHYGVTLNVGRGYDGWDSINNAASRYLLAPQATTILYFGDLAPLCEMFNHAIEDGHVGRNPCLRIMRNSRKEHGIQQKIDFLTREELAGLLITCQAHFPACYPFVLCLARTGLRLGEAIALRWGDVDFAGRFIEVCRSWSNHRLDTPKSGKTRRVDMSLQLTETLRALLLERKKDTLRKGWGEVPEWVFLNDDGTHLYPQNFRTRVWCKLLSKAKLRHLRIHDLRHTFASLLIQNGESLAYVKEQMGHHSIRITVDTYGHLIPGGNKVAVDRLDDPPQATIRNLSATTTLNAVLGDRVTA